MIYIPSDADKEVQRILRGQGMCGAFVAPERCCILDPGNHMHPTTEQEAESVLVLVEALRLISEMANRSDAHPDLRFAEIADAALSSLPTTSETVK